MGNVTASLDYVCCVVKYVLRSWFKESVYFLFLL